MLARRRIFNYMVEDTQTVDDVFHALAQGVRRQMVRRLAERPLTVGELAAPLAMSLEGASKHIRVLERAGLIQRTVQGRTHICRLNPTPLRSVAEWLHFYEQYWHERLDALDALVREPAEPDEEDR
jgi:DNA-binding transcriptional ArsR family regulator